MLSDVTSIFQSAYQHHQSGQLMEAQKGYEQVLSIDPRHLQALTLLGVLYQRSGVAGAAVDLLRRAVTVDPQSAPLRLNLGFALKSAARFEEAVSSYRDALKLKPDYVMAHFNLAVCLEQLRRFPEAEQHYRTAILANPMSHESFSNLHLLLTNQAKHDEALSIAEQALAAFDGSFEWRLNRATSLTHLDRLNDAATAFQAMDLEFNSLTPKLKHDFKLSLAILRQFQNRHDESITLLNSLLLDDPNDPIAHCVRGEVNLVKGRFEAGCADLEWRTRHPSYGKNVSTLPYPRWDGSNIAGRTILLVCEQGLGDTIQYMRFTSILVGRGAKVVLMVQEPLLGIAAGIPGVAQVVSQGGPAPSGVDVQIPLMSLPALLGLALSHLSTPCPYFRNAIPTPHWMEKSGRSMPLRVGLVWAGSSTHVHDHWRSIPFGDLMPLLNVPGVEWFGLQRGTAADSDRDLPPHIPFTSLDPHLPTFTETAATIDALDLTISVDTSVAHLAGAMGKPVWTLIASRHDCRWMLDRSDTPWYPTMRLWRQTNRNDWTSLLKSVAAELAKLVDVKRINPKSLK